MFAVDVEIVAVAEKTHEQQLFKLQSVFVLAQVG
jgi:hypothetical protein